MSRDDTSPEFDDMPEQRESPVRHAHAVEARRHGRASTTGYLGLPADEDGNPGAERSESDGEGDEEQDVARSSRGRGARAKSATTRGSSGKGARGKQTPRSKRQTAKASAPSRDRGASAKGARGSARSAKSSTAKSSTAKSETPKRRSPPGKGVKSPKRTGGAKAAGGRRAAPAAASVKSKLSAVGDVAEDVVGGHVAHPGRRLAAMLAKRALVRGARAARDAGRGALTRAGGASVDSLAARARRLPIQQSLDVAVPVDVAWEQWMEFDYFPEGAHRVQDVARDDDVLSGHLDGVTARDWRAEIIDERENESFAWQSVEGSDSAGLVTFHQLSDRLTRIELSLDVRPTDLVEAASLTLRLADRRVEAELRRFKTHVELLNPDIYEELLASRNGDGPENDAHR
jgi:uncharacterized membrane protein